MSVESYLATVKRMVQWAIRDVNALMSRLTATPTTEEAEVA